MSAGTGVARADWRRFGVRFGCAWRGAIQQQRSSSRQRERLPASGSRGAYAVRCIWCRD